MTASTLQITAAVLFALALIHTFSTKFFERLAHRYPKHGGVFHLLGEVEAVFGFWALILIVAMAFIESKDAAVAYADSRNYTEPLFVFAIMVVAASKPILYAAGQLVNTVSRLLPIQRQISDYLTILILVPLLGSFITEPAAMTLAALLLRDRYFSHPLPERFKYATVGALFVNISIGGTLTSYAAPPVLMVAAKWGFDTPFMLSTFGWKAALAVAVNAIAITALFQRDLRLLPRRSNHDTEQESLPSWVVLVHIFFLINIVIFAHHPAIFMGAFLFFLGFTHAYAEYQSRLILKEGLLVAFFLAGLVVLGGMQGWWLQDVLTSLSPTALFYCATALTAITDNAALTYLGSLVEGVDDAFKYALVAGAVTGGGLTVIANAPNPAGFSILKASFQDGSISAGGLFLAALPPTIVAAAAFMLL